MDDDTEIAPEQTSFRTIHFDDWVSLFMKYGIALAKVGGETEALHDMFRHVIVSNTVWPSEERKLALHLCWLCMWLDIHGSADCSMCDVQPRFCACV